MTEKKNEVKNISDKIKSASKSYKKGDFNRAYIIYRELAELGHPDSQVVVGWMFAEGKGVEVDSTEAAQWFYRAALLNSPQGAFYLGRLLTSQGKHDEAISWYEYAANLGDIPSQFRLGLAYSKGKGVTENLPVGYAYLDLAKSKGHIHARREIAVLDMKGYRGPFRRFYGFIDFCIAFLSGIWLAVSNQHSEKLRG